MIYFRVTDYGIAVIRIGVAAKVLGRCQRDGIDSVLDCSMAGGRKAGDPLRQFAISFEKIELPQAIAELTSTSAATQRPQTRPIPSELPCTAKYPRSCPQR
jgi:hypothetical protein